MVEYIMSLSKVQLHVACMLMHVHVQAFYGFSLHYMCP